MGTEYIFKSCFASLITNYFSYRNENYLSCNDYTLSTVNTQVKNKCSQKLLNNKHENKGGNFVGCVKCEKFDFFDNKKCSLFFRKLQKKTCFFTLKRLYLQHTHLET